MAMLPVVRSSRLRLCLFAAAAPAVVIACLDAAAMAGAVVGNHPWWPDYHLNLSEAAAVRDHAEVVRLIEGGEDPNVRRPVRPGLMGNESDVDATPLEAAISIRRLELIRLLFDIGSRPSPEQWRRLRCAAETLDYGDVVGVLDAHRPEVVDLKCSGTETLW